MSGIKQPILDVMNRLKLIQVKNMDNQMVPLYVRQYKNQIQREKQGDIPAYPRPAAFVEMDTDVSFSQLGMGIVDADLGIKIHLVHDFYNDEDGENFEMDLDFYDIADLINSQSVGLSGFCPMNCNELHKIAWHRDPDPDNIDVFIIEYVCYFKDSTGSKLDNGQGLVYEKTDMSLEIEQGGIPEPEKEHNPYHIQ
jgi:hypothetical protein